MKCKRLMSAVLAVFLLMCFLPQISVKARGNDTFSGKRIVEFTFDSSDLDNYANGGRAAVDLYLRKSAPEWLLYTLRGSGRNVVLTYTVEFSSFEDYEQKIGILMAAQPNILYHADENLILVENVDAVQLLNSLQLALGESQDLLKRARLTKDMLTINGESYDFTGTQVNICPEYKSDIPFQMLNIKTAQTDGVLTRTIEISINADYVGHEQWGALVRRCEEAGEVSQKEQWDAVELEVILRDNNLKSLAEQTKLCLDIPMGLSVNLTEAGEESCTYVYAEHFFLDGYLEEYGQFSYEYLLPQTAENITAISDNTYVVMDWNTTEEGVVPANYIEARNQTNIKFSYLAPFRFEQLDIHTEWSSVFQKIQRTITLTVPVQAAENYHETIKSGLSEAMPKGTVLEIYDQDQTRYYVMTYSSWFWSDIEKFTNAFVNTQIECGDSWIPFGKSSYTEKLAVGSILEGFEPVFSVQLSYQFPGNDTQSKYGSTENGILTVAAQMKQVQITYRQLNIIKLAVVLLGLVIITVAVLIVIRKIKKYLKTRPVKVRPSVQKPEVAPQPEKKPEVAPQPEQEQEIASQPEQRFCVHCGKLLNPGAAFCTNCGAKRT